ncbi:MAG: hypothetical protein H6832_14595 [Planctomycetes bacterium]|nr:hypothetical protein [Planctomycetota bacterium]
MLTYHAGYSLGSGMVYAIEYRWDVSPPDTKIWRSADGGVSYTHISTNKILGTQGSYDSTIWVDPSDKDNNPANDVVVAGGILFWRSTNGGQTFTAISQDSKGSKFSAHNDEHCVVQHPGFNGTTNKTVFVGTDGAIYKTDDIFTVTPGTGWVDLRNSISITQFYGGTRGPTGLLYGGAQDHGSLTLRPGMGFNDWIESAGGDGTFVAADPGDENYLYGAYPNANVHRSSDGGLTTVDITTGLTDAGDDANSGFVAPLILDPNSATRLYCGTVRLWRTDDPRGVDPMWKVVKPAISPKSAITAIAVAQGNPNLVFVGYENGTIEYSTNALAATPTWATRNAGLPARYVTRVVIDPSSSSHLFATFGGFSDENIWESTNTGATWTVRKTTPLTAPVRDVLINPGMSSWLCAATEVGLITSEDGGTSWTGTATPTRAPIDELFWSDGRVWLVSHGRGFFSQMPCGTARVIGTGCQLKSTATGPSLRADQAWIGRTTTFSLSDATANSTAGVMLLGIPAPTPLPFGSNCKLYFDFINGPMINMGAFAIASGGGKFTLPIPNDSSLECIDPMFQALIVTSAFELHLTNGVLLKIGK